MPWGMRLTESYPAVVRIKPNSGNSCDRNAQPGHPRGGRGSKETGAPPLLRRGPGRVIRRSDGSNVLRLRALGALRHVELDLLVLVEGLVALRLDRRVVHEDVVAAVLLRNEAETLLGVEPLHGALSHVLVTPVTSERQAVTATALHQMR